MKLKSIIFIFLVIVALPVFGQNNTAVERMRACNINAGYTINDVVEVMRGFDWNEEYAPGAVFVREAIAATGSFQADWDFVLSTYYPSYSVMTERRIAFRNRSGGAEGTTLSDVATCSEGVRISNVNFIPGPGSDGTPPEVSIVMSTTCELNGAPVANSIAGAEAAILPAMGPDVRGMQVVSRTFGGPTMLMNSQVGFRISFDTDTFGEAFDALRMNPPPQNPDNPLSCNVPGMWAQYLVHVGNN